MKVRQLVISRFRGIEELPITPRARNVILGPNNSGKTTVLEALDLLLHPGLGRPRPSPTEIDYFGRDLSAGFRIDAVLGDPSRFPDIPIKILSLRLYNRPMQARQAGDVVWNPLTGEKALLIESAAETAGARVVVDFAVEEGGFVPGGEHVHDICAEHFDVHEGQITFVIDGKERTLGPGEQVTVHPGSWHRWWNSGEGEVRLRGRIEPALHFEEMILVIWGLCADGHTNAKGVPKPLLGALLATRYRDEIRVRKPPQLVQRLLFPPLAALARRRGMEQIFKRYLSPDTHPSAQAGLGRLPDKVMSRGRR